MTDTQALLVQFVTQNSETAFRELVDRYLNLVYSTALRLVGGDRHLAEDVQRLAAMAKLGDAKLLMLGYLLYGQKNQEQIPTTPDQVLPYLADAGRTLTGTNQFEFIYQGQWNAITNPAATIVLREIQAWQTLDGTRGRTYGFADGHSELHTAPDGNFDTWEQQHRGVPAKAGP